MTLRITWGTHDFWGSRVHVPAETEQLLAGIVRESHSVVQRVGVYQRIQYQYVVRCVLHLCIRFD